MQYSTSRLWKRLFQWDITNVSDQILGLVFIFLHQKVAFQYRKNQIMETTKRQFKLFSLRRQQLFSFYGQWTVSIAWTILSKLWFGLKLRIWFGLSWVRSAVPLSPVWILLKMDKEPPLSPFKSTTRSITPQSTKVRFDCNQSVKFWTSWSKFEPAGEI